MKRAGIGDVHLSGFQSDTLEDNGLPFRLAQIAMAINYIIQICRQRNIQELDFVGDIINDKSIIYTVAQDVFKDIIIQNPDMNFNLVSGNHDMSSTGKTQKSAISVFSGYSNVTCIDKEPKVVGNITFVPFFENMFDVLLQLEPNDILISHMGINEAMLQSGLSKVDKVKLSDLRNFKLGIFGHYHKPQELSNQRTRLYYCGSVIHKDWNDKNEKKRFLIYDTETLEVESLPIEGLTEYREYVIDDVATAKEIMIEAEKAKNHGHIVRVRKKIKEELEHQPHDILVIEQKEVDITNRGINLNQTMEEKLKKYLEIKEIPVEKHKEFLDLLIKHNLLHVQGS